MLGIEALAIGVIAGNLNPPAISELALIEVDDHTLIFEVDDKVLAVFWVEAGIILFAIEEAFDKVPKSLCGHMSRLAVVII